MPVVSDYTALIGGFSWNGIEVSGRPVIVTYSFPTAPNAYVASVGGFTPATVASFAAFASAAQVQARAALGEWAAASALVFIEVAPGQGDINFQSVDLETSSYAGAGGIGFYPFGDWNFFTYPSFFDDLDASGDIFMNSAFAGPGGSVVAGTLLHEIGHALGLKHPTEIVTNFAADPDIVHDEVLSSDDPTRTIMATVGGPPGSDHLQQLDKDAVAFLYGPAGTGSVVTGNASGSSFVSSWSWNATLQVLTQTGNAGDDVLRGSSVADVIDGAGGNDRIFGLAGADSLIGAGGDDLLHGGSGMDSLTGGEGDDSYFVDRPDDLVIEANDEGYDRVYASGSFTLSAEVEYLQLFGTGLTGTGNALANTIFGDGTFGGILSGLAGDDYIVAGGGEDTMTGGADNDLLFGLGGIDALDGGSGNDTLDGGEGNDRLYVSLGNDVLAGDAGTDTLDFSRIAADSRANLAASTASAAALGVTATLGAIENIFGSAFNDIFNGNGGDNRLEGAVGNDQLFGSSGNDTLLGGDGNDLLSGGAGNDILQGGNQDDTFAISIGTDVVTAVGGFDKLDFNGLTTAGVTVNMDAGNYTGFGANLTFTSVERVGGTSGNDTLTGRAAASDTLQGMGGNDTLIGLGSGDFLFGGSGNDTLIGGAGNDALTGEAGLDTFQFAFGDGQDSVKDFSIADDTFAFEAATFGLSTATVVADFVRIGTGSPVPTHGYFQVSTTSISWDADGAGGVAAVRLATYATLNGLTHADFVFV